MPSYNYTGFHAGLYDLDRFRGPLPGEKAPDGTVTTVNGDPRQLLSFDAPFMVLEMGSITCPLFQDRRKGMGHIKDRFPDVQFAVLYVREAHPGALTPGHKDVAEKQACASRLMSDGEGREVLVDGIDGALHLAYGGYPNAVFIMNRAGCVLWQSAWNDPKAVALALADLTHGRAPKVRGIFKPARPWIVKKTMNRAGPGAFADFLRDLPGLIWKNLIKFNLQQRFGKGAPVGPDTRC